MPDINDNDIDALIRYLKSGHTPHWYDDSTRWHAALTALVAERDKLAERLETERNIRHLHEKLASEKAADRDLRERLLESALRGAARDAHMHHEASSMGTRAVYIVDAAIAAMRKGEKNAE